MSSLKDLESRLAMKHVEMAVSEPDTIETLKKGVEDRLKESSEQKDPEEAAQAARKAAMREREYTFTFRYPKDPSLPALYEGVFVSKVPSVKTMQSIGLMRSQLNAGVPVASLDPLTNQLNLMIAHLLYTLFPVDEKKGMPAWATDLRDLVDANVLYALYEEVTAHQRTFLGRE